MKKVIVLGTIYGLIINTNISGMLVHKLSRKPFTKTISTEQRSPEVPFNYDEILLKTTNENFYLRQENHTLKQKIASLIAKQNETELDETIKFRSDDKQYKK